MKRDERFWSRVRKTHTCWNWMGYRDFKGYGSVKRDGRVQRAHRYAYELLVGPIPDGLVIDHLCRNPRCVNPEHLDPVSNTENVRRGRAGDFWRRKTHCPNGHEYNASNTYTYDGTSPYRACRTCRRESMRLRRAVKRGVPHA